MAAAESAATHAMPAKARVITERLIRTYTCKAASKLTEPVTLRQPFRLSSGPRIKMICYTPALAKANADCSMISNTLKTCAIDTHDNYRQPPDASTYCARHECIINKLNLRL